MAAWVVLSNPPETKAIASAKLKTDKVDVLVLANLLRGGYIAESYVPSRRVMGLRELVRYRANLVRIRGSVKNTVHTYLMMNNIQTAHCSLWILGAAEESQRNQGIGIHENIERLNWRYMKRPG